MATLIRTSRLTETSLIVHWCSEQKGLIKTAAKGALRPKSAFSGKLDLFFEAELVYVPSKSGGDLHILREVSVLNAREKIRTSYLSTVAAAYFIRWIEIVAERETPIPELADLLRRALNYIDENGPDFRGTRHFERELAKWSGVFSGSGEPVQDLASAFGGIPPQREELIRKFNK